MVNKKKTIPNLMLRQARDEKKLTQQGLADKIGTTALNVGRWERGTVFPSPYFRHKLCEFFNKSDEELGLVRERYSIASSEDEESQLPIDTAISPENNDITQLNEPQQTDENVDVTSTINHTSEQSIHISRCTAITRRTAIIGIGGTLGLAIIGSVAWLAISHSSSDHTATPSPRSPSLGTTLYTYRGHTAGMDALAWSPDGKRIATASDDYTAQVWDATSGKHAVIYRGHSSYVKGVAWSPDNTRIVSGSADGTAQIWDATTGKHLYTYRGHIPIYHPSAYQNHPWVNRVSWSPDGTKIASCDQTSDPKSVATVQIWDVTTGKTILIYRNHTNGVYAVAWSLDGNRIASAGYDGTLQIWEAATGRLLASYQGGAFLFGLCWSPDSKHVAVGTGDNTVLVVDTSNGSNFAIYNGHFNWVKDVAWSPSGKYIASGSDDGLVILWNTANGENIYTFNGHSSHINAVGWSPSGKLIAAGGVTVQVWEAM